MPPFIVLSSASYQPPIVNGAPFVVVGSPSIAASLIGWRFVTSRPAQSPTMTCAGAASAAKLSATTRPVRWYASRLPRRWAAAYTPATMKPATT